VVALATNADVQLVMQATNAR